MKADANRSSSWNDRLCGGDPDLKCPEHDKMSFMLADPAFVLKLCQDAKIKIDEIKSPVRLEYPLTKGAGVYKTIIGFADAMAIGIHHYPVEIRHCETCHEKNNDDQHYDCIFHFNPGQKIPDTCPNQKPSETVIKYKDARGNLYGNWQMCYDANKKIAFENEQIIGTENAPISVSCAGSAHIFSHYKTIQNSKEAAILIEAKPKLDNPMEILRQLKFYNEFPFGIDGVASEFILLWCPSIPENLHKIFAGQGIRVSTLPVEEIL